jgi:hypothetical protein
MLLSLALLLSPSVSAKEKVKSTPMVAPPAMAADASPEVKGLIDLVGVWKIDGTLKMDDKSFPSTGSWNCEVSSGGYAVQCALELELSGLGPYHESDLFGYDASDHLYHWYSVTSGGEVHDHAGSCDGTVATFQFQGASDGKLYVEDARFDGFGTTVLRHVSIVTVGGKEASHFEGSFTKQ